MRPPAHSHFGVLPRFFAPHTHLSFPDRLIRLSTSMSDSIVPSPLTSPSPHDSGDDYVGNESDSSVRICLATCCVTALCQL